MAALRRDDVCRQLEQWADVQCVLYVYLSSKVFYTPCTNGPYVLYVVIAIAIELMRKYIKPTDKQNITIYREAIFAYSTNNTISNANNTCKYENDGDETHTENSTLCTIANSLSKFQLKCIIYNVLNSVICVSGVFCVICNPNP